MGTMGTIFVQPHIQDFPRALSSVSSCRTALIDAPAGAPSAVTVTVEPSLLCPPKLCPSPVTMFPSLQ